MRLRLAARSSELAKIQAYQVGAELEALGVTIDYFFRAALADQNLQWDLTQSQSKGLFTQDFFEGLKSKEFDLIVHSWKDLPTEENPYTFVCGTLKRADQRDLLFFKKSSMRKKQLVLSSSSPRRIYNLEQALKSLLPFSAEDIQFQPVRGNIHTRIKKLMQDANTDGLLVAKAAIDRLLATESDEFAAGRNQLKLWLKDLQWMILPLSLNPTAAAQGALAIEVRRDHKELIELIERIRCKQTFEASSFERQCLASYGGGCHQKIGTSFVHTQRGPWFFLRGLTDSGEVLNHAKYLSPENLDNEPKQKTVNNESLFPMPGESLHLFERTKIQHQLEEQLTQSPDHGVWVAKNEALPKGTESLLKDRLVWTAGLSSWKKLAARGIWIHGCADGLGEQESEGLDVLLSRPLHWFKLTHIKGINNRPDQTLISTYELKPAGSVPDLKDRKYFYWTSGSLFQRAWAEQAEALKQGQHWCGPGSTYDTIRQYLPQHSIGLALSLQLWHEQMQIIKADRPIGA